MKARLIALSIVTVVGCGGKVESLAKACVYQPCLSIDAAAPEPGSGDGGIECPAGTAISGANCVPVSDSGVGSEPSDSSVDAMPPWDPSSACSGDDDIFAIGGDDNIHTGLPLTVRGGQGWSIATVESSGALPTHVRIYIQDNWVAEFSTAQLKLPLTVGTYVNAERAAFAEPNHPGLDVSGDGIGCNVVAGQFQILALDSAVEAGASNAVVKSFSATFEQHCEAGKRANVGCVRVHF